MALLLATLLGCARTCESRQPGFDRDQCLHLRLAADPAAMPPAEAARVAALMTDPIIREASVLLWVREHRGQVGDADRDALCGLLTGTPRDTCIRRLATAHLTR